MSKMRQYLSENYSESSYSFNQLPNSYDAERAVIGCFLFDDTSFQRALHMGIKNTDFYYPKHRIIFDAMIKIYFNNKIINVLTLTDFLIKNRKLNKVGGLNDILSLASLFPTSAHLETYIKIIINKSILRNLIKKSMLIIHAAMFSNKDIESILESAQKSILSIRNRDVDSKLIPVGFLIKDAIENIIKTQKMGGGLSGVPSGFLKLDNLTNGFHNGELIILAARPSMGKTALALNIGTFITLKLDYSVAFFSFEMSSLQLIQRIISSESQVDLFRIRNGNLSNLELINILKTSKIIGRASLYIDESPNMDIKELKKKCRLVSKIYNIKVIIIDYLQLIHHKSHQKNKSAEIAEVSRELKLISKELNIPILVISQLNRNLENRFNKKPLMNDLRESGAIEQDADLIIFLYREDYYIKHNTNEHQKGLTEVILAKNRNGPTGHFFLKFFDNIVKFANLTEFDR